MYKLIPHQSCHSHPSFEIEARLHWQEKLIFDFTVKGNISSKKKSHFSKIPYKNWGLWEEEVVELFIRRIGESSYLEVQANPAGCGFQLTIIRPRKLFYTPLKDIIKVHSDVEGSLWKGQIEIPQELIPGKAESYEGGIFAILGSPKEYYALNPNCEKTPDFHRPELFLDFNISKR